MIPTITLKDLPFKPEERQVIYVENEYDEKVNRYIQNNYNSIRDYFHKFGYEFCYLPYLVDEVQKEDIFSYYAPYIDKLDEVVEFKSDFLLHYMVDKSRNKIRPSLAYFDSKYNDGSSQECSKFCCISLSSVPHYKDTKDLSTFIDLIQNKGHSNIISKIIGFWYFKLFKFGKSIVEEEDGPCNTSAKIIRRSENNADSWDDDSYLLDIYDSESLGLIEHFLDITEKLKQKGVSIYTLETLIRGKEKLSRLVVTKDYRFFLPDYKNIEIVMTPIHKTLYIFYLRHPEGVFYHDLINYRNELTDIYKELKGDLFDAKRANKSIEYLINHMNNSVYEKSSRIKESFTCRFDDRMARYYYINGKKLEPKKIALPRKLVEWESK